MTHGRRPRIGINTGGTFTDVVAVDEDPTAELRDHLRTERGHQPLSDRGPGYGDLANGKASANVD